MPVKIATLAVKLTASAGAFSATMAGAGKQLVSFGASTISTGSKIAALGGSLATLATGGGLALLIKSGAEAVDNLSKLSDRLGVSTEHLAGLQHAASLAGVSNEQLTTGLEKLLKGLGGAADDGELASNAFTKLGLDAAKLANLPTDEAFTQIAQKISEVPNASERAALAMQVFGKSAQELLPLLQGGKEGIEQAQAEMVKLGGTFTRLDGAKVEQAGDAFGKLQTLIGNVGQILAIEVAPFIEAASNKLIEFATSGDGVRANVTSAFEAVVKAIAYASDYLNLLPAAFHGFRAGALQAIAGVIDGLSKLAWAGEKVLNLFGAGVDWTSSLDALKQGFEQVATEEAQKVNEAMDAFHRGDNAVAVGKMFDEIRAKSEATAQATVDNAKKMNGAFKGIEDGAANLKKVADTLTDLQKQVDQFGLTDAQKKIEGLKSQGASPEQIAQAQGLLALKDQLDQISKISTDDPLADFASKMERLQQLYAQGKVTADQFAAIRDQAKTTLNDKLSESAKQITEDVKSPLQKYQDEVGKLNEMLARGLITQETFDAAKLKAQSALDSTGQKAQATTAIKAGSAESLKLAFESSKGIQVLTRDQVAKQQLKEQETTNQHLAEIARNTKDATAAATFEEVDF